MPGIAGIVSQKPVADNAPLVDAMVAVMRHEKFYRAGTFTAPECGVCAGWVAHENSFADAQVFQNEDRTIALIFSGECFTDAATKNRLRINGHQFSETGGEWLVHFYEEQGESFFEKLNGLFSGLLIDRRRGKIFLFNDRYGMERIYWHETPEAFYFASEAKALLRILPELREFDPEGVAQFLGVGCTMGKRTLFRGVELLPGGARWTFENRNIRRGTYFSPATWESQPKLSEADYETQFRATFEKILPRYFEAESRIGIALTGGLDTRMIMACPAWNGAHPVGYTFAGQKGRTLDARVAAQIARVSGLDHRLLRINSDFLGKFAAIADRTVYITDGCLGVGGAHEIFLNGLARQLAPVRLTGNFGSEVLRSMSTFKPLGLSPELFHPELRATLGHSERIDSAAPGHPVAFAAFREIPWNLFGTLAAGRSQVQFRTPYLDNEIVALAFQAAQCARQSPASALRFVQRANPALSKIPTDRGLSGNGKGLSNFFRHLFCEFTFKLEYLYNDGPPEWMARMDPWIQQLGRITVAGIHKYLPYRHWYRNELADYVCISLAEVERRQSAFWNPACLRNMAAQHVSGRRNWLREINMVLTLDAVDRLLLRAWAKNDK
jgi:asparagine synthase (glutamine-hydrolysing)